MPPVTPLPVEPLAESLRAAGRLLRWIGVAVALAVVASGITVVRPDEVALRLRFGRLTGATPAEQVHGPGLLLSFPYLIDQVVRLPVKRVAEMRIDALTARSPQADNRLDLTRDGYALTGDRNIIQPVAALKYQISDPVTWALQTVAPEALVRDAVVAALTQTLAEMPIDLVLVEGQRALSVAALGRAQARLDASGPWVRLLALEFTTLRPPPQVASYFDQVQSAFVERKTRVDEARAYRARELPQALAEAQSRIREAEAAEATELARARGAASAFLAIREEYRKSPGVVRARLYREAMESIFESLGARILVPPGADAGRILIPGDAKPPGG
jgi:membrane protease subunit HflK